jgi:hypothetical protein
MEHERETINNVNGGGRGGGGGTIAAVLAAVAVVLLLLVFFGGSWFGSDAPSNVTMEGPDTTIETPAAPDVATEPAIPAEPDTDTQTGATD